MTCIIFEGDCRRALQLIPAETVNTCVTSPPYFGLRDYGVQGQIGLEPTIDEFVNEMVEVFREVHRTLTKDGTLWLNLGDSYSRNPSKGGSGPNGKHDFIPGYGGARKILADSARNGSSDGEVRRGDRPGVKVGGLAEKQLLGIPWRVAFALQADGWYLRQDIIWHKPNPMPESVTDRCTKAHEYIFLLSKSPRYYFDAEAILEPASANTHARLSQNVQDQVGSTRANGNTRSDRPMKAVGRKFDPCANNKNNTSFDAAMAIMPTMRNKRDVWTVGSKPFKGAHFATFPPALIEPCILAGAPRGGMVLDPFFGSGTTGAVAHQHGRDCMGIELSAAYIELARQRPELLDAVVIPAV